MLCGKAGPDSNLSRVSAFIVYQKWPLPVSFLVHSFTLCRVAFNYERP